MQSFLTIGQPTKVDTLLMPDQGQDSKCVDAVTLCNELSGRIEAIRNYIREKTSRGIRKRAGGEFEKDNRSLRISQVLFMCTGECIYTQN
jgi:hypothetical protein